MVKFIGKNTMNKAEQIKTLHKRASRITSTLIKLACDGHCTGNSENYSRLFREYKTIEKRINVLEGKA